MGTKSKPMGLAILICDELIEDAKTKKKSLIGLFNVITSGSFPCTHPRIHVFISLTGGNGEYNIELRCLNESTGAMILAIPGKIKFASPNVVAEIDLNLGNVVFPMPGNHAFEFLCDGEMLFHRRFTVKEEAR